MLPNNIYDRRSTARGLLFGALTTLTLTLTLTTRPARAEVGLQVTIVDGESGEPIEGMAVIAENLETGERLVERSSALGKVRFGGLSTSGAWRVKTEATEAFAAAETEPLVLRSLFETAVTLALAPRTSPDEAAALLATSTTAEAQGPAPDDTEVIVVQGSRSIARLNTTNAEISATLEADEIMRIPTQARSLERILFRLPNVSQSTGFFPEAPVVAINGANGLFTNYMIDGLDNNENFLGGQRFPVPVGMAQSVTVLASNYSVEFGRTANGVVNVTTRSGTNELEGNAFALWRPGGNLSFESEFGITDLTGNPVRDDFTRLQAGGVVGGPIVKGKTFYFANVEYTRDFTQNLLVSPDLGVVDEIDGANEGLLGTLRLDHYFSPEWWSTLRVNHGRVRVEFPGGGTTGGVTFPSAGRAQERYSTNIAFTTTYRDPVWEYHGAIQYARFDWNYGRALFGPGPQVTLQNPAEEPIAILGHPGFFFDETENTFQTKHKVVWESDRHRLKLGTDVIVADFSLVGGGNPEGNFVVRLNQEALDGLSPASAQLGVSDVPAGAELVRGLVETQPNAFGATQELYGLYIEDQVQIDRDLSVTLGLRWDYDSLSRGAAPTGDFDNFAPRGGFNWSIAENVVIRGGSGLFYEKIPYALYSDALQFSSRSPGFVGQLQRLKELGILPADASIARMTHNGNLAVDVTEACGGVYPCTQLPDLLAARESLSSVELRILNPEGYDNPYAVQNSLGVEWQPARDWLLSLGGIYSEGYNLVRLRDLNAPAPFIFNQPELDRIGLSGVAALPEEVREARGLVRSPRAANRSRPALVDGVVPAGGARSIIVSETEGRSRYFALNLGVSKARGGDLYDFSFYYTLSRLENNTDDINFRANDANNFDADWGPSLNDRTHVFSTIFNLYPVKGLTVSIAALVQSGQPINFIPDASVFGTTDLNGDGLSFADQFTGNPDRFPGTRRNSGRLDWGTTIDLGIEYRLAVFEDQGLLARVDVLNLLNSENPSGFPVNFTASNQIQTGGGAPFVQRSASPPTSLQLSLQYFF